MAHNFESQTILEALEYVPDLPDDLLQRVKGAQLTQKYSSTRKGQAKISELLKNYQAPMRDKQQFENEIENWKKELEDEEVTKEILRKVFKEITQSEINVPPALKKKNIVMAKKTVETKHGVTWGYNPFTQEKEKLEYQAKEKWEDFKEQASVEVNIGREHILIPSVTVEKMIEKAGEAGLSLKSLGRLGRSFVEAALPSVSAKVNNIHNEDVNEVFDVIEAAIDVEEEIKIVERSLEQVERKPGKFDLADVINNFHGKQLILAQLRTGFAQSNEGHKNRLKKSADEVSLQALYSLVSNETRNHLLQDVQAKFNIAGQEITLERMVKEATLAEKANKHWRIDTTVRPPGKVYGTVKTLPEAGAAGSVNVVNSAEEEENESVEHGIMVEDDRYEDQQFEDEEGQVFMLSGVRRVQMRQSRRRPVSPGKRFSSPSPYRGRVTMIKKYESPRSPAPGRRFSGDGGGKGRDGSKERRPIWKRKENGRDNFVKRMPVKGRTPSRSPGRKLCFRCNSANHLGRDCPRFGKYHTSACPICKKLGYFPQYHDPKVCFRSPTSGYREPKDRSNSPGTLKRYGFRNRSFSRGKSPEIANQKN